MYSAELHGKLSPRVERMEDILTSNVFSFFKYATRDIFLKGYLTELGFSISSTEAKEAEFLFWPHFDDDTEPDLVILVGDYYLLIEAKYLSDFGQETVETAAQLKREIEGGTLAARNCGRKFKLIAITADHYFKPEKFTDIPQDFEPNFIWTNWQRAAAFLHNILDRIKDIQNEEREFAQDLYNLLDKKNLRDFQGLEPFLSMEGAIKSSGSIFFKANTAKFRGAFIGFINALPISRKMRLSGKSIFYKNNRKLFSNLFETRKLNPTGPQIFYWEA